MKLDPDTNFGELLAQLRSDLGISQSEAARRSGTTQDMWSRAELGKAKVFPINTCARLLTGVGWSITLTRDTEQS